MKIYIPDDIEDLCVACVPVGSRVTCNPPPTDTDQDILCLFDSVEAELDFEDWILKKGWQCEGEKYGTLSSEFASWRKDVMTEEGEPDHLGLYTGRTITEYNLILTHSTEWFDKFLKATVECKKQNAMTKKERVAIFDGIMGRKTTPKVVTGLKQYAGNFIFNQMASQQAIEQAVASHEVQGGVYSQSLASLIGQQAQVHIYDDFGPAQGLSGNPWQV